MKLTKRELEQRNAVLSAENAELRAQLSALSHDATIPPATRKQAMAHARELAKRTGTVVKV